MLRDYLPRPIWTSSKSRMLRGTSTTPVLYARFSAGFTVLRKPIVALLRREQVILVLRIGGKSNGSAPWIAGGKSGTQKEQAPQMAEGKVFRHQNHI